MQSNLPRDHYPVWKNFPEIEEVEDKAFDAPIELGVEYERSTITIPLMVEGFPEPLETLVFTAHMRLRRETPTIYDISDPTLQSPLTRRQFRFKIEIWEVVGGESNLMGGDVLIALSDEIDGLRTATLGKDDVNTHLEAMDGQRKQLQELDGVIHKLATKDDAGEADRKLLAENRERHESIAEKLKSAERKLSHLRLEACKQPWSLCHSDQMGHDFPATIVYNAYFDVWLRPRGGRDAKEGMPEPVKLIHTQPGVAIATNVKGIPPRDVVVTFHKPMSVTLPTGVGKETRRITFADGACTGMSTITSKSDFLEGVNRARAIRGAAPFTIDEV